MFIDDAIVVSFTIHNKRGSQPSVLLLHMWTETLLLATCDWWLQERVAHLLTRRIVRFVELLWDWFSNDRTNRLSLWRRTARETIPSLGGTPPGHLTGGSSNGILRTNGIFPKLKSARNKSLQFAVTFVNNNKVVVYFWIFEESR